MPKPVEAGLSSRRRPAPASPCSSPAIARGKRPDRRNNLLDRQAEGAARALPTAFFAAAPDVGRQDPDPRPCTAAGNGPPSAPVGFESAAGRIRPGGILQAPDVPQSESNRQRSLGQTKTCPAKTSNCPRRPISRTEIHSGFGRTISNKVRFPPQSVSAERIRRAFSLIDACGHLFGRFGSAVTELRVADLGKAFPSWSSARQARRLQSGGSRRRIGARRHRIGACRVRRGRCRVRRGRY